MSAAVESTPQPEPVPGTTLTTSAGESADVMRFSDATVANEYSRVSKHLPFDSLGGGLDLGDFFERWTLIKTMSWDSSAALFSEIGFFDPWYLYLTNVAISRKLAGFQRLRADLDIRFTINASATQYGMCVVGCIPQGTEAFGVNSTQGLDSSVTANETMPPGPCMFAMDFVGELRPVDSASLQFELPWIAPTDALELSQVTNTYGALSGGPQTQWRVRLLVINSLCNSTDMTTITPLTIRAYARLRNVCIDIPIPQAPKTQPHPGVVGRTASAVSQAAALFKSVPGVSSLASGVEVVSAAVGAVADYYGFTRESTNPSGSVVAQRAFGNLVSADADDLDVPIGALKGNKVSIDPAIAGSSTADQLAFANFCARRFFIGAYTWSPADAAGTVLATIPVHPWPMYFDGGGTYCMSASGYVAANFTYWRGDMIYELEIIGSKQHRGRIQVVYYPTGVSPTADPTNSSYNMIYDFDCSKTPCFRIGWSRGLPALPITPLVTFTPDDNCHNGYYQIIVQTELTCPDPTANIHVNVFSRGGPELQFFRPARPGASYSYGEMYITPQAGDEVDDLVPTHSGDASALVFGERVDSIRTLIQMPMLSYVVEEFPPSSVTQSGMTVVHASIPMTIMPVPSVAARRPESNYTSTNNLPTYLRFFNRAFLGWRGSFREKAITFANTTPAASTGFITQPGCVPCYFTSISNSANSGVSVGGLDSTSFGNFWGQVGNDGRNGTVVEARVPYWSAFRYEFSRLTYQPAADGSDAIIPRHQFSYNAVLGPTAITASAPWTLAHIYESAADDFTFVMFRFIPLCNLSNTPT